MSDRPPLRIVALGCVVVVLLILGWSAAAAWVVCLIRDAVK